MWRSTLILPFVLSFIWTPPEVSAAWSTHGQLSSSSSSACFSHGHAGTRERRTSLMLAESKNIARSSRIFVGRRRTGQDSSWNPVYVQAQSSYDDGVSDLSPVWNQKDCTPSWQEPKVEVLLEEVEGRLGGIGLAEPSIAVGPAVQTKQDLLLQEALNAMLLIACFGYAIYTVVNVDIGITRGWTQVEIARRIPVDNWASYESALAESPIQTKTLINVIIYLLGDWLSQTLFQGKNPLDFDAQRTLRNGFIGLCFGPLVHLYYDWSDHILPVEQGMGNRLAKIVMDQTLYLTVKCSIYLVAVGMLAGDGWDRSTQSVKEKIVPICQTAWKFWPLVHCVTYGLIPARHRVLWVNSVDLVWNAILASKASNDVTGDDERSRENEHSLELAEVTAATSSAASETVALRHRLDATAKEEEETQEHAMEMSQERQSLDTFRISVTNSHYVGGNAPLASLALSNEKPGTNTTTSTALQGI